MPTSIPIMRATTTSADASPCICSRTEASIEALTGAIARPKPSPQATSTGSLGCSQPGPNGSPSVVAVQRVIARKAAAVIAMPAAATRRLPRRWESQPPAIAPMGTPTRSRSNTRAAPSCELGSTVDRARTGMSSSAAINAAPTARLVSSAP